MQNRVVLGKNAKKIGKMLRTFETGCFFMEKSLVYAGVHACVCACMHAYVCVRTCESMHIDQRNQVSPPTWVLETVLRS